jgi:hypothetical protein
MNMKRNQHLGLMLAGLLFLGTAGLANAAFTGELSPANWQQSDLTGNPGTYTFTGAGGVEFLTIIGSASGPSDTFIQLKSPFVSSPSLVSLTWSLQQNGNNASPVGYYIIDKTPVQLIGAGTLNNILLPAGTPFSFELPSNVISEKSPAQFQVSVQVTPVPEVGTYLAGLFGLGVLAFEILRRKAGASSKLERH